jgi:hypothetical protein
VTTRVSAKKPSSKRAKARAPKAATPVVSARLVATPPALSVEQAEAAVVEARRALEAAQSEAAAARAVRDEWDRERAGKWMPLPDGCHERSTAATVACGAAGKAFYEALVAYRNAQAARAVERPLEAAVAARERGENGETPQPHRA